jgi:hypothetical protein
MTNLLPLEDFRKIIGYNPYHFFQLADNTIVPVTSATNTIMREHSWQDTDAPGRQQIREAIETAEGRLRDYLGYYPAPKFLIDTVSWQKFFDKNLVRRMDFDPSGHWISARLPSGYIQAVGLETYVLLDTPRITYSDQDGDGLNDTATFTVATTITDITQLGVYFQTADRLDAEEVGERWRIAPVKITLSGGVATFVARAWLFVEPVLYEGVGLAAIDPTNSASFVANVEVYRHWADPAGTDISTSQGVIYWETAPCHGWWCGCSNCNANYTPANSSSDPSAYGAAVARVGIRNAEAGIIMPAEAVWNSSAGTFQNIPWEIWREPDRVLVRYLAGKPWGSDGDMDKRWQTIVARLACAEMPARINAADMANKALYHWQFDLARSSGAGDEGYGMVTKEMLNNPFGTRRGHVYAWQEVKRLQLMTGIVA